MWTWRGRDIIYIYIPPLHCLHIELPIPYYVGRVRTGLHVSYSVLVNITWTSDVDHQLYNCFNKAQFSTDTTESTWLHTSVLNTRCSMFIQYYNVTKFVHIIGLLKKKIVFFILFWDVFHSTYGICRLSRWRKR